MRSQQILLDRGLFDARLVDQAYNYGSTAKHELRAGIAWGMLNFVT
jgi:hypothetical protein